MLFGPDGSSKNSNVDVFYYTQVLPHICAGTLATSAPGLRRTSAPGLTGLGDAHCDGQRHGSGRRVPQARGDPRVAARAADAGRGRRRRTSVSPRRHRGHARTHARTHAVMHTHTHARARMRALMHACGHTETHNHPAHHAAIAGPADLPSAHKPPHCFVRPSAPVSLLYAGRSSPRGHALSSAAAAGSPCGRGLPRSARRAQHACRRSAFKACLCVCLFVCPSCRSAPQLSSKGIVVLALGALNSARMLMLSGVGPAGMEARIGKRTPSLACATSFRPPAYPLQHHLSTPRLRDGLPSARVPLPFLVRGAHTHARTHAHAAMHVGARAPSLGG